jgi:hypothetical protein
MKIRMYLLPALLGFSAAAYGGGFDFSRMPPPTFVPQQDVRWESLDVEGEVNPVEADLLMALQNYEKAIAQYGEFSREAQAAASDLDAAILIYVETAEGSR